MNKQLIDRQLAREVVVGIFTLICLVGLGIFTIVISKERLFVPAYKITVRFDNVMGMRTGDEVAVRGMTVGKVRRMELVSTGILVHATLNTPVRMRKGYKISIVSSSVLGGSRMQIDEGNGEEIVADIYEGTTPHDIMSDSADIANALKKTLIEKNVLGDLAEAASQIKQITTRLSEGHGTLGKFLSEDEKIYRDIQDTVSSFKDTAASVKQMVERIDKGEGVLGKLVSKDSKLYDDLSATANSLREITERVKNGEGLVGKILKDDSLYDELKQTIKEAKGAIDEVRESTPLVTFTSIFFGAF